MRLSSAAIDPKDVRIIAGSGMRGDVSVQNCARRFIRRGAGGGLNNTLVASGENGARHKSLLQVLAEELDHVEDARRTSQHCTMFGGSSFVASEARRQKQAEKQKQQ